MGMNPYGNSPARLGRPGFPQLVLNCTGILGRLFSGVLVPLELRDRQRRQVERVYAQAGLREMEEGKERRHFADSSCASTLRRREGEEVVISHAKNGSPSLL